MPGFRERLLSLSPTRTTTTNKDNSTTNTSTRNVVISDKTVTSQHNSSKNNSHSREFRRVVLLGGARVGKSSIVSQFLYDRVPHRYRETVEEMHRGEYSLPGGDRLTLDILDTSGSLQFPAMRKLALDSADAYMLVYAVDDAGTWREVAELRNQILECRKARGEDYATRPPPIVVVGNKCDILPVPSGGEPTNGDVNRSADSNSATEIEKNNDDDYVANSTQNGRVGPKTLKNDSNAMIKSPKLTSRRAELIKPNDVDASIKQTTDNRTMMRRNSKNICPCSPKITHNSRRKNADKFDNDVFLTSSSDEKHNNIDFIESLKSSLAVPGLIKWNSGSKRRNTSGCIRDTLAGNTNNTTKGLSSPGNTGNTARRNTEGFIGTGIHRKEGILKMAAHGNTRVADNTNKSNGSSNVFGDSRRNSEAYIEDASRKMQNFISQRKMSLSDRQNIGISGYQNSRNHDTVDSYNDSSGNFCVNSGENWKHSDKFEANSPVGEYYYQEYVRKKCDEKNSLEMARAVRLTAAGGKTVDGGSTDGNKTAATVLTASGSYETAVSGLTAAPAGCLTTLGAGLTASCCLSSCSSRTAASGNETAAAPGVGPAASARGGTAAGGGRPSSPCGKTAASTAADGHRSAAGRTDDAVGRTAASGSKTAAGGKSDAGGSKTAAGSSSVARTAVAAAGGPTLGGRVVERHLAEDLVRREWRCGYAECSARTGLGVVDAFKELLVQANVSYNLSPAVRRRRQSLPAYKADRKDSISGSANNSANASASGGGSARHQREKRHSCTVA